MWSDSQAQSTLLTDLYRGPSSASSAAGFGCGRGGRFLGGPAFGCPRAGVCPPLFALGVSSNALKSALVRGVGGSRAGGGNTSAIPPP